MLTSSSLSLSLSLSLSFSLSLPLLSSLFLDDFFIPKTFLKTNRFAFYSTFLLSLLSILLFFSPFSLSLLRFSLHNIFCSFVFLHISSFNHSIFLYHCIFLSLYGKLSMFLFFPREELID